MKPIIIAWNTGRNYTQHGQRMAATILPNGDIYFSDYDRMISGHIPSEYAVSFLPSAITSAYDRNNYVNGYPRTLISTNAEWDESLAIRKMVEEAAADCIKA